MIIEFMLAIVGLFFCLWALSGFMRLVTPKHKPANPLFKLTGITPNRRGSL